MMMMMMMCVEAVDIQQSLAACYEWWRCTVIKSCWRHSEWGGVWQLSPYVSFHSHNISHNV